MLAEVLGKLQVLLSNHLPVSSLVSLRNDQLQTHVYVCVYVK